MQTSVKARSPPRPPPPRSAMAPTLHRSSSQAALAVTRQADVGAWERLQRGRPMRNVLLLFLSLILAANCVWAVQGVAAWRRARLGPRPLQAEGQQESLVLRSLNATTLSVEVSRVDGSEADRSTYVVNAQLVDNSSSGAATAAAAADLPVPHATATAWRAAARRRQAPAAAEDAAAEDAAADAAPAGGISSAGSSSAELPAEAADLVARLQQVGSILGGAAAAVADGSGPATDSSTADGQAARPAAAEDASASSASADAPASSPDETPHGRTVPLPPSPPSPPPSPPPPPPPPPHRAVLRAPEVDEQSGDACAQALALPKVALLFLTRGDLPHHALWARWFEAARGQLPAEQLRAAACSASAADDAGPAAPAAEGQQDWLPLPPQRPPPPGEVAATAAAACGWNASSGRPLEGAGASSASGGSSAIDGQHLFSVYIHAPPSVTDEHLPDTFRGRLITDRLQPEWGTHQLVEATRALLWEAHRDPLNQRFVLVSETDLPLYDPLTFHQQLVHEGKSRVNLCRDSAPVDARRWSWRMAGPALRAAHWRKSSQWFGLLRSHVATILADVAVFRKFEAHCWNGWDGDLGRWRDCFSDEHYFPTLLASKGLEAESFCSIDGLVAADWSAGGAHPKAYKSWEVKPALFHSVRGADRGCNASDAIADAQPRFVTKQQAFGWSSADGMDGSGSTDGASSASSMGPAAPSGDAWRSRLCSSTQAAVPPYTRPLPGTCSLTVRKFPKPTVHKVSALFSNCSSGLQLLGPAACK